MPVRLEKLDLSSLGLSPGAGRRIDPEVPIGELRFAGERYTVQPALVPVRLDVSRLSGPGYALRVSFEAVVHGPCMRCLKEAGPKVQVEAREVDTGGTGDAASGADAASSEEELTSPYVERDELDLASWARDALVLSLPAKILCREDCPASARSARRTSTRQVPTIITRRSPIPRWAKLRELRLD